MKVQYSKPLIDEDVVNEVNDIFTNTGWLTSGPKVKEFESELCKLTTAPAVACVNSWVSGAMLILRWFGVGPGDEVIIPSYTYSATALAVMNIGAVPVMVDVREDFNIDVSKIEEKITAKTKVIIPVDLGGWPCDYNEIMHLVNLPSVVQQFIPASERQQRLGRILVLTDAAHSIGAVYSGRPAAVATDFAVFSFHSVKNITTGEGGAICINLPVPFNNEDEFKFIKFFGLNGQTKSAYEKNQPGSWRYDIIDQGMKVNMPDICAAVGLSQVRRYVDDLLPERKKLYDQYNQLLGQYEWAILPPFDTAEKTSSYHLYMLRIKGFSEAQRDNMISLIAEKEVAVNVHYIPMPMLTLFKNCGYKMEDYPVTYQNYSNEITLPLYNRLSTQEVTFVVSAVVNAYNTLMQS